MGNLNLAMFSYLLIFYIINNRIGHIAICIGGGVTDQDNFIADLIIAVNRKCKLNIGAGQLKLNILIIVKLEAAWCHHIGRIIINSGDLTFDCHFTGLIGTADLLGAVCPDSLTVGVVIQNYKSVILCLFYSALRGDLTIQIEGSVR